MKKIEEYYHPIEKILTDFKNGATYSDSIEKIQGFIAQDRKELGENLDTLINKAGEDFRWIKKRGHGENTIFLAQLRPHPIHNGDIKAYGKTAKQALTNALALLTPNEE